MIDLGVVAYQNVIPAAVLSSIPKKVTKYGSNNNHNNGDDDDNKMHIIVYFGGADKLHKILEHFVMLVDLLTVVVIEKHLVVCYQPSDTKIVHVSHLAKRKCDQSLCMAFFHLLLILIYNVYCIHLYGSWRLLSYLQIRCKILLSLLSIAFFWMEKRDTKHFNQKWYISPPIFSSRFLDCSKWTQNRESKRNKCSLECWWINFETKKEAE